MSRVHDQVFPEIIYLYNLTTIVIITVQIYNCIKTVLVGHLVINGKYIINSNQFYDFQN